MKTASSKETSKDRAKFRQTKAWKQFRAQIIADRGSNCEACGAKSKRLNLHHKKPEQYDSLIASNYVLLCAECHKHFERVWGKIQRGKDVPSKEAWISLLGPFFD